jgi:hypothetical protein
LAIIKKDMPEWANGIKDAGIKLGNWTDCYWLLP